MINHFQIAKNKKYRLSALAKEDLLAIFEFSISHWGEVQARRYAQKLSDGFDLLSEAPKIGLSREELNDGALSFAIGSHDYILFNQQRP